MIRRPPQSDVVWFGSRLLLAVTVVLFHPLPLDLHRIGIIVPTGSRAAAYYVFELVQIVVVTLCSFFWEMLPGMSRVRRYFREIQAAGKGARPLKAVGIALAMSGIVVIFFYIIAKTLELLAGVVPAGEPRFIVATISFIIDRAFLILSVVVLLGLDEDDTAGPRIRKVVESIARRLRSLRQPARVPTPSTAQRGPAMSRVECLKPSTHR